MPHSEDHPGLRLRLAHASRRLPVQHDFLDALLATTGRALERMPPEEAQEAMRGFRGALEAHFQLEEEVHFPALHGLDSGLEAELGGLVSEHHALRDRLLALEGRLGREPGPAVAPAFAELAQALRQHESREERLFLADVRADDRPES